MVVDQKYSEKFREKQAYLKKNSIKEGFLVVSTIYNTFQGIYSLEE